MSDPSATVKYSEVPDWALDPFRQALTSLEELDQILDLTIRGITAIGTAPMYIDTDKVPRGELIQEKFNRDMDRAIKEMQLAQQEIAKAFPLLHAQALVSLWASLEATVQTFLANWLAMEPSAMSVSQLQRLRIQLGEYESLDSDEKRFYILDLLERETQAPLKQGINRFETPLAIFGLSGELEDADKRKLFELYHLRNAIVHRRNKVDRKLASACPWLGFQLGTPIAIDHVAYEEYLRSVFHYVIELIIRVATHFGVSRAEMQKRIGTEFQVDPTVKTKGKSAIGWVVPL